MYLEVVVGAGYAIGMGLDPGIGVRVKTGPGMGVGLASGLEKVEEKNIED